MYNYWLNELDEVKFTHVDWVKPRSGTATSATNPPVRIPGATTPHPPAGGDAQASAGKPDGVPAEAGGGAMPDSSAAAPAQDGAAQAGSSVAAPPSAQGGAQEAAGAGEGAALPAQTDAGPPAHLDDDADEVAAPGSDAATDSAGSGAAKASEVAGEAGKGAAAQNES